MDQPVQSKHTGKKIWYGTVITLSAILLLLSTVGVIGAWVMQGKLSDATVALLQTAEDVAGRAQELIAQVEEPLSEIQQISTTVAEVSADLSQNVKDEGLLKLLLPPEQEQKLTTLAAKVQDTLATIHEVLSTAASLYQAIDQIPFITLPVPGLEKVRDVEQTVSEIRIAIEELKAKVTEVRAGAADKIGMVTEIADQISTLLVEVLEKLAVLDSELEGFQQTVSAVKSAVPTAFVITAFLLTLVLVYIAYTQVEVIRLFVRRWHLLGAASAALPHEASSFTEAAKPVEEAPALIIENKPAADEPGEGEAQS